MDRQEFLSGRVVLHAGDCRDVLRGFSDNSIDSIVTDPPYALVLIVKRFGKPGAAPAKGNDAYARASAGFMGKEWDTGEAAFAVEFWAECLRVLKPGGHVAAFSGTRTYHRLACAIEDSGFEIRDQLAWTYGTGFPKSHDVSKAIDKAAGASRDVVGVKVFADGTSARRNAGSSGIPGSGATGQSVVTAPATDAAREWEGWGTALKPAWEPIALARKPLIGTVAENVLQHGTGALNIDGCRVAVDPEDAAATERKNAHGRFNSKPRGQGLAFGADHRQQDDYSADRGRHPANILHDGSPEVLACFPETGGSVQRTGKRTGVLGAFSGQDQVIMGHDDAGGSAARFFYSAKADSEDRIGSKHPTVKPVDLMQWLCRLITPPGGVVLDPFAGTGTTGEAAFREGFRAVLVEREAEYRDDIARRMALALAGPQEKSREILKAKGLVDEAGPLFEVRP